jgi:hypothetical protein
MMNERIKKLPEQAGYEEDMFGIGHWDMPEFKKFAELLVMECMGCVTWVGKNNTEPNEPIRTAQSSSISVSVKNLGLKNEKKGHC